MPFQWPPKFWGTARSYREPYQESKEPGEPQESGFSPRKSLNQVRWMCWGIVVNFAATLFKAKSLVRMECAEKVLMSTSSAISRIVTQRSRITTAFTLKMTWPFRLVGRPKSISLYIDMRPSLNRLLVDMLLVSRSGLVEEHAVEVFHYYGYVQFQAFSGKIIMW